ILKSELVHFVVADGPCVLRGSRHIAISLLRCTRVCVLPCGLVLPADFNSGDRTRAHVCAKRQAVVAVDVVIDTQRVKTGAFKYREVAPLRVQRLIRTRNKTRPGMWATGGESGKVREKPAGKDLHDPCWPRAIHCHLRGRANQAGILSAFSCVSRISGSSCCNRRVAEE